MENFSDQRPHFTLAGALHGFTGWARTLWNPSTDVSPNEQSPEKAMRVHMAALRLPTSIARKVEAADAILGLAPLIKSLGDETAPEFIAAAVREGHVVRLPRPYGEKLAVDALTQVTEFASSCIKNCPSGFEPGKFETMYDTAEAQKRAIHYSSRNLLAYEPAQRRDIRGASI